MKFHLDYEPINWNEYINQERTNKYIANNTKQKDKKIVGLLCRKKYEGEYPIEIIFTPHFDSHRKDLDNFRVKGIIDGLVANKIIQNDNLNCIQKITLVAMFDDLGGVDIEIKNYKGDKTCHKEKKY